MRTIWRVALVGALVGAIVDCCRERPVATARLRTGSGAARGAAPAGAPARDAAAGYVLFAPLLSTTTYLIDREGRVVHVWESAFPPGVSAYLLGGGRLLRCGRQPDAAFSGAGGEGGRLQEIGWDGSLLWDYQFASDTRLQHHDIEPLPNGDVLLVAWERKSREQALAAGRRPDLVGPAGLWPDCVFEVRPERPRGGTVVWEWHLWDHLVQDHDRTRENYGIVSDHSELVDVNGGRAPASVTDELRQRLRALGYLARGATAPDMEADFAHTNSVAYDSRLDQIVMSVSQFNEIWIIDHGTTTLEAAGHRGGRAGRGGDVLYRWGNPQAYGRGTPAHQRLFGQHDARWVPDGYPGAGHLTVFDNGAGRPGADRSFVLEIAPPVDAQGRYARGRGGRFGPEGPVWEYPANAAASFFAEFISGAQRLPDGNTLVCDGPHGRFFEVTPDGITVWEYENPFSGDAPNPNGDPPFSVFWASHVPADHPGLAGRSVAPLDPQPSRAR